MKVEIEEINGKARVPEACRHEEPKADGVVCTCRDKMVSPVIDGEDPKLLQLALQEIGRLKLALVSASAAIDRQILIKSKAGQPGGEYNFGYLNGLMFARAMLQGVDDDPRE